jgi:hypothetical protein
MKLVRILAGGAVAALVSAAMAASAQATEYQVLWSGAALGDGASAVGYFDIDPSVYPGADGFGANSLPDPAFQLLSLTVTGASAGNGVFDASDFGSFYFWTPSALNLSTQLIGQTLSNGLTYGPNLDAEGETGDFNVFSNGSNPSAPTGNFFFILGTSGGDLMEVTSIAPVAGVPEPATWAMLILGVAMVGFAARNRRNGLAVTA